ncbi:MAG: transcription antitermination factor NusB [Clostridia bacterium]|nr:transcription antitermination factor NusB [Clostridia bacterium]
MRSNAREAAFKIIFSELFQENAEKGFKSRIYKNENLNEEDAAFAERLVTLVEEHRGELSSSLTEKIERFAENRVYKADKAIMLLGLAEIRYCDDVPPLVSVSEAATLARKYSTENSANFVSGVLGGFIQ